MQFRIYLFSFDDSYRISFNCIIQKVPRFTRITSKYKIEETGFKYSGEKDKDSYLT